MIPLEMERNNKYYVFIKQCNDDLYLYEAYDLKRKNVYYKETFKKFDLEQVQEIIPATKRVYISEKW